MKFKEVLNLVFTLCVKLFGIPLLFAVAAYGFGISIIGMAAIGFAVNFIAGTVFTYIFNHKHEKLVERQVEKIIEFEKSSTVKVKCAYCNQDNIVPIDLTRQRFICIKCSKVNRLVSEFSTARVTDMKSAPDMISQQVG